MMRFFNRNIHNPKYNPLSKKIVDVTEELLKENGMDDIVKRGKCCLDMFQATIRHVKAQSKSMRKGGDLDTELERQAMEYCGILEKYGIADKEKREELVLKYMDALKEIGG